MICTLYQLVSNGDVSNQKAKKKLILITDVHGREMVPSLAMYLNEYSIEAVIKSNASSV